MTRCRLCVVRGKTWSGSDPKCAFDGRQFQDNWNCATLNALRNIVGTVFDHPHTRGVNFTFHEDQNYAMIPLCKILGKDSPADVLWMSWYKDRGRTEAIWLLSPTEDPRCPTEDECLSIIAEYANEVEFIDEVRVVLNNRR